MKLAIVGAGLAARTFHVPAFMSCEGVEISAVYDRKEGKALALAEPLGAEVYTDYSELLARSGVDAVSICTRTDMHCPMALEAARAGKSIFLEKPMALSAAEAKQIMDAVEENGVTFMLGMLNRFRTETLILDRRRREGLMGEIYHADARWVRRRGIPSNPWFAQKALSGGGAGIDIGVHALDLAWYLMGCPKPLTVSAMTHSRLGDVRAESSFNWGDLRSDGAVMDVEEAAVAFIRFEGHKSMTLTVSWAINGPEEDLNLKIYGSREGASLEPFVIFGAGQGGSADIRPSFFRDDAWMEGFRNEAEHFVRCVREGLEPISSARNCYTVQRIIDTIYGSASLGRELAFD